MSVEIRFNNYINSASNNVYTDKSEIWSSLLSMRRRGNSFSGKENFLSSTSREASGTGDIIGFQSRLQPALNYLSDKLDDEILQKYPSSIVGNPDVVKIRSHKTSLSHLWNVSSLNHYIDYLFKLKERNGKKALDIIEIGPGYGAAAHILISLGLVNSYTLVDLIENLGNSVYFLNRNYPDWEVNFIESKIDFNTASASLNFVSADRFGKLPHGKFDAAINSDSVGEMPRDTALNYINCLPDLVKSTGLIISINGHRRGQYSLTGINRVSDYNYNKFKNILFTYKNTFSSSMDDFGHVAICENSKPSSVLNTSLYDVMGDLFAMGVNQDVKPIIDEVNEVGLSEDSQGRIELWDKLIREEDTDYDDIIGKYISFVRRVIEFKQFERDQYDFLIGNMKSPQALYFLRLCKLIVTSDWNFWSSEKLDNTMFFLMSDLDRFKNKSKLKKLIFLEVRRAHLKKKFFPRREFKLPLILRLRQMLRI